MRCAARRVRPMARARSDEGADSGRRRRRAELARRLSPRRNGRSMGLDLPILRGIWQASARFLPASGRRGRPNALNSWQGHVLALEHGASRLGGARLLDVRLVGACSTRHVAPSLRANPRASRSRLLRRRHLQSARGGGAHPRGGGAREAAPSGRPGCSRPIPAAPSAAEQCTRAAPLRAAALRPSGLRPSGGGSLRPRGEGEAPVLWWRRGDHRALTRRAHPRGASSAAPRTGTRTVVGPVGPNGTGSTRTCPRGARPAAVGAPSLGIAQGATTGATGTAGTATVGAAGFGQSAPAAARDGGRPLQGPD